MTTTATALDPLVTASPSPSPGTPGLVAWYAEGFSDRLGDRLQLFDNAGPALELLRFPDNLAAEPGFERALRARVSELEWLRHPAFAHVRSVTVLDDPRPQLALVSELAEGERLSAILRAFEQSGVRPDPGAALWLLRRLLPGLAALHDTGPRVVHGLLTPTRVVLAPGGRLTISEHVFGSAVSALGLDRDELWRQFGAVHREQASFDRPDDVAQAALLATSVLLGRPLRAGEHQAAQLTIEDACHAWPSAQTLRPWLERALALRGTPFESAREALAALDDLVSGITDAWPAHLLPAGSQSSLPVRAADQRLVPTVVSDVDTSVWAAVRVVTQRLLGPATPPEPATARRLRMTSAALAAIALAEAIGLLVLLGRGPAGPVVPTGSPPGAVHAIAPVPAHSAALASSTPPAPPAAEIQPASSPTSTDPAHVVKAAARSVLGWVMVESSVPVKVYANGRLLGTGASARYHLPAGQHTLTLVNRESGINYTEPLQLAAGQTVLVAVDPPAPQ